MTAVLPISALMLQLLQYAQMFLPVEDYGKREMFFIV